MDFTLSDEARELAALTRELAASGRPLWPALAEAGVLAAALPKRAGGEGYGLIEQCAILVELGRAAATVPYLPSIVAAAATLARFGTDDQVASWAAPAGQGRLVLTAAPTPGAPVPAADQAALVLVPDGSDVLLVRTDDPAVTVRPQRVDGGPGAGLVHFAGAETPRLAGAAAWLAAHATVGACAAQLGVVERALEMTAGYARSRIQFGRPIGSFQAVSQRLADAYIDVEALRLALWQAAWSPGAPEVATAGFWAAEAGHRVLHAAVHVHGGVGLDIDYPLHRYFLAAKHHEFLLGGATGQLLALADTFRS
ncbi:acyl-CoA dehydrogenase family protein [Actinoplanes regularis]|uniref:Acyl-CoA dehydrogenase n=1 Tax=Actinoplanes regularis TaxID=52697 RepID=A0A238Z707_9ACTN|nr:acyl-CoA dehydrogenase family protein [Actinoplanes regularis]GIE85882.1 acyl-CoA dehydrogenase [Actinoplanes regularis]SNR79206.1 Acyl-CoA dehydrogenase [Actinoplanes regularis]